MTKFDSIADSLLKPINPSVSIILGAYTILWGFWIFNPFWMVFTHAPLYAAMAHIAPEYLWGIIAIVSGMFITRGAIKPSYRNLQLGAFIGFFHWFIIAILYFVADWQSTGGITALAFAVYSAIIWVNVKVNRKHFN